MANRCIGGKGADGIPIDFMTHKHLAGDAVQLHPVYYDLQHVTVTPPVNLAPGTYYIGGIANSDGIVAKTNTGNNTYDTVQLTVTAPTQNSSNPITIANGASTEIAGSSAQAVTFSGATGNLILDSAVSFSGTVAGMTGQDTLDLEDVSFATLPKQGCGKKMI